MDRIVRHSREIRRPPKRIALLIRSRRVAALIAIGGATVLSTSGTAYAQTGGYYDRDANISVLQRPRPDYDSLGISLGEFQILPSLTVAPQYDSNIFATQTGAVSDLITAIQPAVSVRSNWARHEVDAYARLSSNIYADHSEENTTDYAFGGAGRLDILSASNITAGASYADSTIPRTAEDTYTNASKPVQYDIGSANLGALQTINRLRFSESAAVARTTYGETTDFNGQPLSLGTLDNTATVVTGRSDYALSPALAAFATVQGNNRHYGASSATGQFDRSSNGYQLAVGADFDITQLIRGQFQLGYLSQNYQSNLFHTVTGPAANAKVEYFLSALTTITLTANRDVIDAVDPTAISFLQTHGGCQIDHQVRENIILSAKASYETDDFKGVQRNDQRESASLSGTYLLNRYLGLTAGYSLLNETSSGQDRVESFIANVVSLSLVLRL